MPEVTGFEVDVHPFFLQELGTNFCDAFGRLYLLLTYNTVRRLCFDNLPIS